MGEWVPLAGRHAPLKRAQSTPPRAGHGVNCFNFHFGKGGGAPPWTPSPHPLDPPPAPLL